MIDIAAWLGTKLWAFAFDSVTEHIVRSRFQVRDGVDSQHVCAMVIRSIAVGVVKRCIYVKDERDERTQLLVS